MLEKALMINTLEMFQRYHILLILYIMKIVLGRVVMVVGAGRGPLVRASLAAAKNAQRLVRVYAVEKNPNAIVT